MIPGDGQRRIDAKDGRTYEVRSAIRPDPSDYSRRTDLIVCLCAAAAIVAVFVYVRVLLPSVQ